VGAYAGAIASLLQDPQLRNQMGAAARDRVERYFTWDRHVRILDRAARNAVGEAIDTNAIREVPLGDVVGTLRPAGEGSSRVLSLVHADTGPIVFPQRVAANELVDADTGRRVRE
jgi:hypothetical protein